MKRLVTRMSETYLSHLRTLSKMPSVFTSPKDLEKVMAHCQKVLASLLPDHRILRDAGKNLIALPSNIDPDTPLLYLSAHVDMVDADPEGWSAPFSPFKIYEDETQMVGRGVSDCKAGVAFQLFLAELVAKGILKTKNLAFTLTFKEEGAGTKTGVYVGKALGKELPTGTPETRFLVLENTVSVFKDGSSHLGLYTAERGNFVLECRGTPEELQNILAHLSHWNPVAVSPVKPQKIAMETLTQTGGHACSVPREKNRLTAILFEAHPNAVISAGDPASFGVIPTEILVGRSKEPVIHTLILSNRSFDTLSSVQEQVRGIAHREVKPFAISKGMDGRSAFAGSAMEAALEGLESPIAVVPEINTGASDASIVLNAMAPELQGQFTAWIMGPGTRSMRHAEPPRLTHGVNETFHKRSGLDSVAAIFEIARRLGHLDICTP